jgi:uncharacterized repeat protein (TIGR01451 family)
VVNTASVSAVWKDPDDPVTAQATETVTATQVPQIDLAKTVEARVEDPTTHLIRIIPAGEAVPVGTVLNYTITAENTGNVTLHHVLIREDGLSLTDPSRVRVGVTITECHFENAGPHPGEGNGEGVTLAPGELWVCTASYVVTQDDVDSEVGGLTNHAHVDSDETDPEEPEVLPETDVEEAAPGLIIDKVAYNADKTAVVTETTVGQQLTYVFMVTNTGNVTLNDLAVTDLMVGLSPIACPDVDELAPDESFICEASYVVTQADLDAREVHNTAWATALDPDAVLVSDSDTSQVGVAGLSLTKTVTPDRVGRIGQKVTYSFVVTNVGAVPLTGVVIEEIEASWTGTGPTPRLASCTIDGAPAALDGFDLAVGQSAFCQSREYVVTGADFNDGTVVNEAQAIGHTAGGLTVHPAAAKAVLVSTRAGDTTMWIEKGVSKAEGVQVGDQLVFSYRVWNLGGAEMDNVTVIEGDEGFTGVGPVPQIAYCELNGVRVANGSSTLPANQLLSDEASLVCYSTAYTVLQADFDADDLRNVAAVEGDPADGGIAGIFWSREIQMKMGAHHPDIAVLKWADKAQVNIGDQLTYSFSVENTGNVTVTYSWVDPFTGASGNWTGEIASCRLDSSAGVAVINPLGATLAPGDKVTCVFEPYTVVAGDVGNLVNSINVSAKDPGDEVLNEGGTSGDTTVVRPFQAQTGGLAVGSSGLGWFLVMLVGAGLAAYGLRRRRVR